MITMASIFIGTKELPAIAAPAIGHLNEMESSEMFSLQLPIDDPTLQMVLGFLEDVGMRPWVSSAGPRRKGVDYLYVLHRLYSPADLADCSLLELQPLIDAHIWEPLYRNSDGEIVVPEACTPPGYDILAASACWRLVSPRAKAVFEQAGFRHVHFRPTVHVPRRIVPEEGGEPEAWFPSLNPFLLPKRRPDDPVLYWELDSDFTLPPVSPSMTFEDSQGRPVQNGDFARGFRRKDGFHIHPELHYRASDLASLPPFDLARTYEPFGTGHGRPPLECPLVASKRFYECCVQHGFEVDWVPVRVDSEPGPLTQPL